MKRIILVLFVLSFAVGAFASDNLGGNFLLTNPSGALPQMTGQLSNGMSLGYVKVGTTEVMLLSWKPDFKIGPWIMGLDFNIPAGSVKPPDMETVVLRLLGYDDGQKGLLYGVINNVSYGAGLLMKNYTTRVVGPVYLDNKQMGFRGYMNTDRLGVDGMATWSQVYSLHFSEPIHPLLILGQTYVTDTNGKDIVQPDGTNKHFPAVSGVSINADLPLPSNFKGYAELAQILGHGKGFTAGLDWGMDMLVAAFNFNMGYRVFDNNFVPGYFNENFETNPIDLASYEAASQPKNGYIAEFNGLIANVSSLRIAYEAYQGSNASLNASAAAKYDPVFLNAYYSQPNFVDARSLTLEEGAVMGADVGYKINPYTTLVTHYKKAYNPSLGKVEETQVYEVQLSF